MFGCLVSSLVTDFNHNLPQPKQSPGINEFPPNHAIRDSRIPLIVRQTSVVNSLAVKKVAQVVLGDQIVPKANLLFYTEGNLSVGHVVGITDLVFDLWGK